MTPATVRVPGRPVVVRIPGAPPLPNQSTKAGSWHARATSRAKWRGIAFGLSMEAVPPSLSRAPIAACVVDVTHILPDHRKRDLDNLAAAIKPLLDGIVDAGVITGDDTSVIRSITHTSAIVKGVRETVIAITPVEGDA